ncbi:hypothetical protein HUJ05_000997 [Dendroctonus ponderosae]|nr:hypothetical protein HUJ05_000997 [Dendroctonus ponderosae]
MMSTKTCMQQRGGDFYVKHDPCWMPVRNLYPFDANQSRYFWIVFPIETVYSYHVSCFFSLATATIIGFLIHIGCQFKCCSAKFEHVFDTIQKDEESQKKARFEFIELIKYYQGIQEYSQRVFQVFSSTIIVYIALTSLLVAVIGYQIVNPKISTQDRIKYAMLLVAWCLLVYSICLYGQELQDEALKVGDSIFKSNWHKHGMALKVKPELIFTLARTQKPLEFKTQMIGSISLMQFMRVSIFQQLFVQIVLRLLFIKLSCTLVR